MKNLKGSHNHVPDEEEIIRRTTIYNMKERARQDAQKSVKQIYNETVASAAEDLCETHPAQQVGASLPTYDSVATILSSARSKVRPSLLKSREEIRLDELWTQTTDGQKFLHFDDGSSNKILGFTTDALLQCLCDSQTIFMDGTFNTFNTRFMYSIAAK